MARRFLSMISISLGENFIRGNSDKAVSSVVFGCDSNALSRTLFKIVPVDENRHCVALLRLIQDASLSFATLDTSKPS